MILKELYLYPDLVDFDDDITQPFRDQSRSICNYLERQLKLIKFKAEGFKRICFVGKAEPRAECNINSSNIMIVEVRFDEKKYRALKKGQLNAFFYEMIESGINKCQEQYEIPADILLEGLEEFRKNGYLNSWTFKTKMHKGSGIKCALECSLTVDAFHLNLVFYKGKDKLLSRKILTTEPDEIVFSPMFKELLLDGDSLVVLDKFGDVTYSETLGNLNLL